MGVNGTVAFVLKGVADPNVKRIGQQVGLGLRNKGRLNLGLDNNGQYHKQ